MGNKWKTSINPSGPMQPECEISVGNKWEISVTLEALRCKTRLGARFWAQNRVLLQSSKIGTCVSRFQCVCVAFCLSLSFSVFLCLSRSFSVFLCLCFTGRVHCKPKNPIDPRLCFFVLPPLRALSTRCDSLFSSLHVRDFRVV